MKQYIVDAFTDKPFHGNPAAVCVVESYPDEKLMMDIAMENNLSETAFIAKESDGYHLRWFTPTTEVGLCGHATLASGFVMLKLLEPSLDSIEFITKSGKVAVSRKGGLLELSFPNIPVERIDVSDSMQKAFGTRPIEAWLGLDLICVFESEDTIKGMTPDLDIVKTLPGRLHNVTAKCSDGTHDCISRSFAPTLGIPEDPVCGSAHCQIAPLWSMKLSKKKITAFQASKRGGSLFCEIVSPETIKIAGPAVLFAQSEILQSL